MTYLILLLVVGFLVYAALRHFLRGKRLSVRQFFAIYIATMLGILLVVLGVRGLLHPLFAALGAALPFLLRALFWLPRALQLAGLYRFFKSMGARPGAGGGPGAGTRGSAAMTEAEALHILGLGRDAQEADIIAAHRKKMQKAHPDRGGSTAEASRLNAARDLLLRLRGKGKRP